MTTNHSDTGNPKVDLQYRKKKNAEDMRMQLISFALMIFLTLIAFLPYGAIALADGLPYQLLFC